MLNVFITKMLVLPTGKSTHQSATLPVKFPWPAGRWGLKKAKTVPDDGKKPPAGLKSAKTVPGGGKKPPAGQKSAKIGPDDGKKPPAGLKTAKTVPEGSGGRDAAAGGCVHYRA